MRKNLIIVGLILSVAACESRSRSSEPRPLDEDDAAEIDRALRPKNSAAVGIREGLAAAVMIDVSGSMREEAPGSRERKIEIAKRAARDLVEQFARYADDRRAEPVELAIYEFSSERRGGDVREVVRMSRPDRAAAERAIAAMRADGGTPIGEAMIVGKRALDATGLSRRHLLVITDGENTDGHNPSDVATVLARRPVEERPSFYLVAFDVDARRFDGVKNAGGFVLEASSGKALGETIDSLLRGKILIERD